MIPAADGVYPTDEAARTAQTISTLQGMLIAVAVIIVAAWALSWLRKRDTRHDTLVPMQSRQADVWREADGCYGVRTDDFVDAGIAAYEAEARKADAEALLAMDRRQREAAEWEAKQAARKRLHAKPVSPDVVRLEAWYAQQPTARKELGR